ncbi:hypothetical protein DERP_004870 [Dermatophagoides pteronyssinus]|uniref:Uncharacterized protein n=1 Tax=Dermatophagoides pteronyssinus TaxID=6956 RepID=A0ABQ8JSU8_DERPT|nr:hypothetical protein DERP_004870 [Dermatophagoides pteronyssinus]
MSAICVRSDIVVREAIHQNHKRSGWLDAREESLPPTIDQCEEPYLVVVGLNYLIRLLCVRFHAAHSP